MFVISSQTILPYNLKPWGLQFNFIRNVKKDSDKGASIMNVLIRTFFINYNVEGILHILVFIDGCPDVGGNVKFLLLDSNWSLIFLIVNVRLNIGENWMQIVVNPSNESNESIFIGFLFCCNLLWIIIVFFNLSGFS